MTSGSQSLAVPRRGYSASRPERSPRWPIGIARPLILAVRTPHSSVARNQRPRVMAGATRPSTTSLRVTKAKTWGRACAGHDTGAAGPRLPAVQPLCNGGIDAVRHRVGHPIDAASERSQPYGIRNHRVCARHRAARFLHALCSRTCEQRARKIYLSIQRTGTVRRRGRGLRRTHWRVGNPHWLAWQKARRAGNAVRSVGSGS